MVQIVGRLTPSPDTPSCPDRRASNRASCEPRESLPTRGSFLLPTSINMPGLAWSDLSLG
jgi:hypothetical protein